MGKRVIYWANQNLFIFDGLNIYHMDTTSARPGRLGAPFVNAICLIDSMESMGLNDLPLCLMQDERLFIIQAASSNPSHKHWARTRPFIREFLLNPPEEKEILQVSGLSSLVTD